MRKSLFVGAVALCLATTAQAEMQPPPSSSSNNNALLIGAAVTLVLTLILVGNSGGVGSLSTKNGPSAETNGESDVLIKF